MGGTLGTLAPAWAWKYAGLVVLGSFGFWYNIVLRKGIKKEK